MDLRWLRRLAHAIGVAPQQDDAPDMGEPTLIQISTAGYDPDVALVGSSPFGMDPAGPYLEFPAAPSAPNNRYLFRLCGWTIPHGLAARIVAFGQYLELRAEVPEVAPATGIYPAILPVTTPGWRFTDGNVAWGITARAVPPFRSRLTDPGQLPSTSPNVDELQPALIYRPDPSGPVPYTAPAGGQWPGSPLVQLGLIRDIRTDWKAAGPWMDYAQEGPCDVVMFASGKQTDPNARPLLTFPPDGDRGSLCPEDRFLLQFPQARYGRIGGFLVLEVGPTHRFARRRPAPCMP